MSKDILTPRERWEAVLKRQKPDRLPMDYWSTQEATEKLMKYMNVATPGEVYKKLHIDRPVSVYPAYIGPEFKGTDIYGCKYKNIEYNGGIYSECIFNPLAEFNSAEEIKKEYTWPSIDWYDFSVIPDQIKGKEDYPVQGGGSEPFLIYKNLRGQEQAFMDLILHPDIVEYCLDNLFDICYKTTERIYEQIPGKVTYSYVAEDMGSEKDLMYAPKHIKKFLLPRMKKMIDLAHDAGVFVFHHNDGAITKILPDLIGIGIDILNPIQWNCAGMNREDLKRDYGDKLIFHGGVDNQFTLAFGNTDKVKAEVIYNIGTLGKGGGYILAPCHNIQSISPPENIVQMYETGYEYGFVKE